MPEIVNHRDLRVSDEEREHVVGLLQRAIGRGMIDLDEFTERTDIAYSATTRGQLNVVLSDLPGLVHRDAPSTTTATQTAPRPEPGASAPTGDRVDIVANYSNITRNGRWLVPPRIGVQNKAGNTHLDFTNAEFTSDEVQLELDLRWGSLSIKIPEGAAIDTNALTDVRYSSIDDRSNTNGMAGTPRIVVTGRVKGSSLSIRGQRSGWFNWGGGC